jgi:hypothetical protein
MAHQFQEIKLNAAIGILNAQFSLLVVDEHP